MHRALLYYTNEDRECIFKVAWLIFTPLCKERRSEAKNDPYYSGLSGSKQGYSVDMTSLFSHLSLMALMMTFDQIGQTTLAQLKLWCFKSRLHIWGMGWLFDLCKDSTRVENISKVVKCSPHPQSHCFRARKRVYFKTCRKILYTYRKCQKETIMN